MYFVGSYYYAAVTCHSIMMLINSPNLESATVGLVRMYVHVQVQMHGRVLLIEAVGLPFRMYPAIQALALARASISIE
jgi:hypothetical protein